MPVTFGTVIVDHISDSTHVDIDLIFAYDTFTRSMYWWSRIHGIQQFNMNFYMEVLYSYVTQLGPSVVLKYMTPLFLAK